MLPSELDQPVFVDVPVTTVEHDAFAAGRGLGTVLYRPLQLGRCVYGKKLAVFSG